MIRVTRQNPCPVCGKPDYCFITDDGTKAVCMRVPSEHPTKSSDCQGYVHILKDTPREARPMPVRHVRRPVPRVDPGAYMDRLRAGGWSAGVAAWLAGKLGVSAGSLESLAPAADFFAKAFAFPMRDGHGKVVGIRYRAMDGSKWSKTGSAHGLFYRADIQPCRVIAVCEGPTDTAAALTLGLSAVGRASCSGGEDMLNVLFTRLGVEECVIVADNDGEKLDSFGNRFEPGLDGAVRLASRLCVHSRIVIPPSKDIREWVRNGATLEAFNFLAVSASWHMPSVPRPSGVVRPVPVRRTEPVTHGNPLAEDEENFGGLEYDELESFPCKETPPSGHAAFPRKQPAKMDRGKLSSMWRKAIADKKAASLPSVPVSVPVPELTDAERSVLDSVIEVFGGKVADSADTAVASIIKDFPYNNTDINRKGDEQ